MATLLLIKEAIDALKDRTGSSVPAINKYIETEKKVSWREPISSTKSIVRREERTRTWNVICYPSHVTHLVTWWILSKITSSMENHLIHALDLSVRWLDITIRSLNIGLRSYSRFMFADMIQIIDICTSLFYSPFETDSYNILFVL